MTKHTTTSGVFSTEDGSLSMFNDDYQEHYHSKSGALAEAQNLYMQKSGFRAALENSRPGQKFSVLDIGLGLGYNALATIENFLQLAPPGCSLELKSIEKDHGLFTQLINLNGPWQATWATKWREFVADIKKIDEGIYSKTWESGQKIIVWQIYIDDGLKTVEQMLVRGESTFDFIWQDAFSPKKNPELWSQSWFSQLAKLSNTQTVMVTYSVARMVKDALEASGWSWHLVETGGSKKQWLRAHR